MGEGNKFRDAKKAAVRFLDEIGSDAHVSLVRFGGSPLVAIEVELAQGRDRLRRQINGLKLGNAATPMAEAIGLARRRVLVNGHRDKVIVLLTDGVPMAQGMTLPQAASRTRAQAGFAKDKGIRLIAIGVGNDIDHAFLKQIASTPEDYHFVKESVRLESTFTTIASRLVTESSQGGGLTKL